MRGLVRRTVASPTPTFRKPALPASLPPHGGYRIPGAKGRSWRLCADRYSSATKVDVESRGDFVTQIKITWAAIRGARATSGQFAWSMQSPAAPIPDNAVIDPEHAFIETLLGRTRAPGRRSRRCADLQTTKSNGEPWKTFGMAKAKRRHWSGPRPRRGAEAGTVTLCSSCTAVARCPIVPARQGGRLPLGPSLKAVGSSQGICGRRPSKRSAIVEI